MSQTCRHLLLTIAILFIVGTTASAENWPGWRGPRGDGTSLETGLPTKWSGADGKMENIVWKTPIPGLGHSSPIVWNDRVFLTTAVNAGHDRDLLCIDRKSGKILWQKTVVKAPLEAKQGENSYASSTPITDGKHVYVTFLDGKQVVVASYDFDGKQQWIARPGQFDSMWGFCHSPVLFEDKVLVACCGKTIGCIAALKRDDGKTVWTVKPRAGQSFSNPFLAKMDGRTQMIVIASKTTISYDPATGNELWTLNGPSTEGVATPLFLAKPGLLLIDSSWPVRYLVAVKPDGSGDITASKVAWKTKEGASYVSSPIATGDYVMSLSQGESNCFYCYEAATGNIVWKAGTAGRHHASPVAADGLVYFLNDEGQMNIVRAGPKFELVATNELGEETYASPAISQGQVFLRGFHNLYCVGK